MFTVSTPHFLVNIIAKREVADHLIPNIKKLDIVYFLQQDLKGGRPAVPGDTDIVKVQILCRRGMLGEVANYVKEYYVKVYGAVCYFEEVKVPM